MRKWLASVERFLRAEDGPTAVEYAVMLALIVVVCVSAFCGECEYCLTGRPYLCAKPGLGRSPEEAHCAHIGS